MKANKLVAFLIIVLVGLGAMAQRKVTPVNNKSTATQPINEFVNDTARINAKIRARLAHYHDENGNVIYIDTITGKEWRDTSTVKKKVKQPMQYPLLHAVGINVDLWNPIMRAFGQHYGLIGFGAQLSMHNRYFPTVEVGLGQANTTPSDNNFTYKTPISPYFRLGADYNFLYNSNPDYKFFLGLRFGFSPFKYSVEDITITSNYWDETAHPVIPTQSCTVSWWEFNVGLQVRLWGPISAGWSFRYYRIMHESSSIYGQAWYVPGMGTRSNKLAGTITVTYTLNLNTKRNKDVILEDGTEEGTLYFPDGYGEPTPSDINQGLDAETPAE